MNLYQSVRPMIFKLEPEAAHRLVVSLLSLGGKLWPARQLLQMWFRPLQNGPRVRAFGLTFDNPIGLAAGFDKNGEAVIGLGCLGFGHVEVGTVTPRPQPGNPRPRIYRLVEEEGIINRMGFNNDGASKVVQNIQNIRRNAFRPILGINIGKNKSTPAEDTAQDYVALLRTFAPLADYLTTNISSPNTVGLRDFQERSLLENLLGNLAAERANLAANLGRNIPLLVKLAPDLTDQQLEDALDVITRTGMNGVVISNTTIGRRDLKSPLASEPGGLSGAPLRSLTTKMVQKVVQKTHCRLPVIASGGVLCGADAQAKLDAGATLVQLYSGMIYAGPGLARDILNFGLQKYRDVRIQHPVIEPDEVGHYVDAPSNLW